MDIIPGLLIFGYDIPFGTKKYFQSPISTSAHAPTDIGLLERAQSSENTI